MGYIDCHIHHYPEDLIQDPSEWAKARGEHYWATLVGPKSVQGWADTNKLLKDMDGAGIEKAILLGWYWAQQSTCDEHNAFQTKCIQAHPDRLMAFASVQPLAGDKAFDAVKKAIDQGHCGIGEIFHKVQGFEMNNPTWTKILEWAEVHSLPINFHVTDPVGATYTGKTSSPFEDYEWVAQQFPHLKIILAHLGGLLPFHELNASFAKTAKNIYYDTAASPLMYEPKVIEMIIKTIGADRLLYGSDYPLKLYPTKQKEPEFLTFINELKKTIIDPKQHDSILCLNIQKVLEKI